MKATARNLRRLAEAYDLAQSGQARTIRQRTGLSARAVGQFCGVRGPTITRWETGRCRPTGQAAVRWLRLMRDLDGLIDRNGECP